jgi:chemotaxis protein methyltransferase CheR
VGKHYRHALTPDEQGHDTDIVAALRALLDQGQGGCCASVPAGDVCALLARLYANHGKLREALTWCDKAVAANKLDPSIHHLRAIILHEQGRLTEAVTSLKRALYLDPDFVLAHIAMGYLTRRLGKVDVSARHVAQALSLLHYGQSADRLRELEGMTAEGLADIMRSVIQRVTS